MRDALALALVDLRTRLRAPGAVVWAALAAGALALASALAPGGGEGLAATWFAWVLGGLALLLAAASAASLPEDRASGRAAWLASLAAPPWARRAGAALSGLSLACAAALGGALLVGVLAPLAGLARPLRAATTATVAGDQVGLPPGAPPTTGVLLAASSTGPSLLEVTLRRRLVGAPPQDTAPIDVGWQTETGSGTVAVPWRGPLRLELPEGSRRVRLELAAAGFAFREGWVLGGPRSWLLSWLWAGLLLGLGVGWLALLAVAVSRSTSAATAALVTVVIVSLAGMRAVLPDLAGLPAPGAAQQAARGVLEAALFLAPDLSALAPALEPARGRALDAGDLAGLARLLPHALAALALLLLPGRVRAAEEGA